MPRRAQPAKRQTPPDAKYQNVMVSTLINKVMERGKKSTAQKIVYDALQIMEQKSQKDGITVLEQAIKNVIPLLEVKPRRVGGATYQVPVEVRPDRGLYLAIRWILQAARARKGQPMKEKLAAELMDALQNTGATIKKREDTHKMAEANRAFAHYRW